MTKKQADIEQVAIKQAIVRRVEGESAVESVAEGVVKKRAINKRSVSVKVGKKQLNKGKSSKKKGEEKSKKERAGSKKIINGQGEVKQKSKKRVDEQVYDGGQMTGDRVYNEEALSGQSMEDMEYGGQVYEQDNWERAMRKRMDDVKIEQERLYNKDLYLESQARDGQGDSSRATEEKGSDKARDCVEESIEQLKRVNILGDEIVDFQGIDDEALARDGMSEGEVENGELSKRATREWAESLTEQGSAEKGSVRVVGGEVKGNMSKIGGQVEELTEGELIESEVARIDESMIEGTMIERVTMERGSKKAEKSMNIIKDEIVDFQGSDSNIVFDEVNKEKMEKEKAGSVELGECVVSEQIEEATEEKLTKLADSEVVDGKVGGIIKTRGRNKKLAKEDLARVAENVAEEEILKEGESKIAGRAGESAEKTVARMIKDREKGIILEGSIDKGGRRKRIENGFGENGTDRSVADGIVAKKGGVDEYGSGENGVGKSGTDKSGAEENGDSKVGVNERGSGKSGVDKGEDSKGRVEKSGVGKNGAGENGTGKGGVGRGGVDESEVDESRASKRRDEEYEAGKNETNKGGVEESGTGEYGVGANEAGENGFDEGGAGKGRERSGEGEWGMGKEEGGSLDSSGDYYGCRNKKCVVVGAGITGMMTAYMLAKNGAEVSIVDKNTDCAMGASFANGGQFSFSHIIPFAMNYGKSEGGSRVIGYLSKLYFRIMNRTDNCFAYNGREFGGRESGREREADGRAGSEGNGGDMFGRRNDNCFTYNSNGSRGAGSRGRGLFSSSVSKFEYRNVISKKYWTGEKGGDTESDGGAVGTGSFQNLGSRSDDLGDGASLDLDALGSVGSGSSVFLESIGSADCKLMECYELAKKSCAILEEMMSKFTEKLGKNTVNSSGILHLFRSEYQFDRAVEIITKLFSKGEYEILKGEDVLEKEQGLAIGDAKESLGVYFSKDKSCNPKYFIDNLKLILKEMGVKFFFSCKVEDVIVGLDSKNRKRVESVCVSYGNDVSDESFNDASNKSSREDSRFAVKFGSRVKAEDRDRDGAGAASKFASKFASGGNAKVRKGRTYYLESDSMIICNNGYDINIKEIQGDSGVRGTYPVRGYSLTFDVSMSNYAPSVGLVDCCKKTVYSRYGNFLRVAGLFDVGVYSEKLIQRRLEYLKKTAFETFPILRRHNLTYEWSGLRIFSDSEVPIVKRVDAFENVFLNTGHGALGMTLSSGCADIIARMIHESN